MLRLGVREEDNEGREGALGWRHACGVQRRLGVAPAPSARDVHTRAAAGLSACPFARAFLRIAYACALTCANAHVCVGTRVTAVRVVPGGVKHERYQARR